MYVFTVVRAAGTDLDAVHVEGVTVVHLGARPGEEAEHPDGEPGGAYHQGTQRRHGRPALDLPRHERQRPPCNFANLIHSLGIDCNIVRYSKKLTIVPLNSYFAQKASYEYQVPVQLS